MIVFTISEPPFGWQRTGKGFYTTPQTRAYEKRVGAACEDVMRRHGIAVLEGALRMMILAYYPIPKSTSKKKRALMAKRLVLPTVKPDADNVAKAIKDALNKLAYRDDAQIAELVVLKLYDPTPRVEVLVEKIGGPEGGVQSGRKGPSLPGRTEAVRAVLSAGTSEVGGVLSEALGGAWT